MSTDTVPRPLRGVRVLELAQNLAGPYCGQILADLGAEVIKVERAGGDAARSWGPPFVSGAGSIFIAANRGKQSVTLDLRSDGDRERLKDLIGWCDVLIEAFRPGALARLGFDYEAVRRTNERLIYCSVMAYGEQGPLRDLAGYDPLMQAHGGLMSVTGEAGGRGVRVGTSVVDMGTGMWLAIAVLAALRERDASGTGARLSVALYETALAWNAYHIAGNLDTGAVPRPMGSELPMIAPYGSFPTRDGEVMIGAANDGLFVRLCHALDLHLAHEPRFGENRDRVGHREELNAEIGVATRQHSTDELLELLQAAGVPCAPVLDIAEVAADPQTNASGMVGTRDGVTALSLPVRWNGARLPTSSRAPDAGEHTSQIFHTKDERPRS